MFEIINNLIIKITALLAGLTLILGMSTQNIMEIPIESIPVQEFPIIASSTESNPIMIEEEALTQNPVPSRPDYCIDKCFFNWDTWQWELYPETPVIPPTIVSPQPVIPNQPITSTTPNVQIEPVVPYIESSFKFSADKNEWVFVATGENFRIVAINTYRNHPFISHVEWQSCSYVQNYYSGIYTQYHIGNPYSYPCASQNGYVGVIKTNAPVLDETLFVVKQDSVVSLFFTDDMELTFLKVIGERTNKEIIVQ